MLDWLADLLDLPAAFRSTGPGGGVIQDSASSATLVATLAALHRASGGAWRTDGCGRPVHRVHLDPGPLLHREGGPDRRASATPSVRAVEVDTATLAMRPGGAARGASAADRRRRATPGAGGRHDRHHLHHRGRPAARDRRDLPRVRGVAARRRRLRRRGRGLPGAALDARRAGARRLVLLRPAQVAAHRLRLRRVLGRRPGRAGPGADGAAGVPAQRGDRVRRGDRLPGLAGAAGPAVPGAQAVVRAALVRRRGAARPHPRPASRWPTGSRRGSAPTTAFEIVAPHPFSLVCFRLRGRRRGERRGAGAGSTPPVGST